MAITRITEVRNTDGTIREVEEVFRGKDIITPVTLGPGEEIILTQQASTVLARMMDGKEDPSSEELLAEMRVIREVYKSGDFVDITDKIK